MPRPKLPTPEKRHRAAVRKARWREQVGVLSPAVQLSSSQEGEGGPSLSQAHLEPREDLHSKSAFIEPRPFSHPNSVYISHKLGQNSQRIESNSVTRPSELVEEVTLREPEYSLDFQLFGGDLDEGTFLEDEDSGIRQTPSIDESISNRGFRIRDKSNDPATSRDENSPINSP